MANNQPGGVIVKSGTANKLTLWALTAANTYTQVPVSSNTTVSIVIDGGGSAITTGSPTMGGATVVIPSARTIVSWTVEADASGSIVVDVLRANAGVPSASIVGGGNKPTLSSAQFAGPTNVSGWTSTALAANDVLGFSVSSAATVTRVTVTLILK